MSARSSVIPYGHDTVDNSPQAAGVLEDQWSRTILVNLYAIDLPWMRDPQDEGLVFIPHQPSVEPDGEAPTRRACHARIERRGPGISKAWQATEGAEQAQRVQPG